MCTCKFVSKIFPKKYQIEKWKFRNFSIQALGPKTIDDEVKIKYKNHSKELDAYFSSNKNLTEIKQKIPARLLKRNKKIPDDLYLVDKNVAKTIANTLIPHLKEEKSDIVETNPGFGFITEKLLQGGIPKILVYEPTVSFRDNLFKLDKQYPNRLRIYNKDFFSIWKLSYQDKYDNGDRVQNMVKDIEVKDWNDDVAMNIIGVLPNPNFVRHLILSLIFQYSIMTHGRCNLYICVPPFLYLQWTAQPTDGFQIYRPSSVLMQTFCDFKILAKVPRKCFLPWDSHLNENNKTSRKKFPHFYKDPNHMYLVKMSFKKPLPVSADKLQHYWFFTKHLMISRKNRVIPMLEKWIPGCGWNLITEKSKSSDIYPYMNIYTRVGDMTPTQILTLFKTFISWPEFTECSFVASMEAALLKMEHSAEDPLESNVKDETSEENQEDAQKSTKNQEETNSNKNNTDVR